MDFLLKKLDVSIKVLADFLTKIFGWILQDHGIVIPPWGLSILKCIAIVFALYILSPAVLKVIRKAPGITEKFVSLFTELLEKLLEALHSVISEKIPSIARFITSSTSYSRMFLWSSATDHEALAMATSNNSGINRRLLAPYHGQLVLGLVVFLLSIWSGIGLSFAVYMSLKGKVTFSELQQPPVSDLSISEIAAVIIAGCFFALMILSVDRTIVSTIQKKNDQLKFILLWITRILVSLVLASWIAETYAVFLNRHLIETHLEKQIDQKIIVLEASRITAEKSKDSYIQTNAPNCMIIKDLLAKIPARLERESLKCPSTHKTSGECKGVEYRGILAEEKNLNTRFANECSASALKLPDYLSNPGMRIDKEIKNLQSDKTNLIYDISQGGDALQSIGQERFKKRHPNINDVNYFDQFITWFTFGPHKTFMVLLIIDLLPLIVKMLIRTSYFSNLGNLEEYRDVHAKSFTPNFQGIAQQNKELTWESLFGNQENTT